MAPADPCSHPLFRSPRARLPTCILIALAQSACVSSPPTSDSPDLRGKLAQRDAQIDNLQKRVQQLERLSASAAPAPAPTNAAPPPQPTIAPVATAPHPTTPPPATPPVPPPMAQASPPRPTPGTPQKPAGKPAPGAFDVDEEAAERALDRTLVISGALLLPYGQFEVQPGFSYQRYSKQQTLLLNTPQGVTGGSLNANTDIIGGNVFARLGLPYDAQIEANIPYQSSDTEYTSSTSAGVVTSQSTKGTGFGDFRLGLAKTLLTEKNMWPDVIARFTWDSETGQIPNRNPIGSGFDELQGAVTLTKRQDPLVFIGTVSYQSAFEKNGQRPGDTLGFQLGSILGASPETSLRIILAQSFVNDFELNGKGLRGTDRTISVMNFGASTILGKGMFLDFTAGVGLTQDAPDYTVGTSLATRFDLPFLPRL